MIPNQVGLPRELHRYKGNLHAHSTASDGRLSPHEVAEDFRNHGYQFLCLSEHDRYTDTSPQEDSEHFIILPGLEASAVLWDSPEHNHRRKYHHIHGILGTDEMVAGAPEHFQDGEYLPIDEYETEWDGLAVAQKLVNNLRDHGCVCIYNHPIWSRIEPQDLLGLQGIFGIEIYNYDTMGEGGDGQDTVYWDLMLRRGQHVNGIAADDSHHMLTYDDVFGGWVVVSAAELSRNAIVSSLVAGTYYSSNGPDIESWGVTDGKVWVDCSPCERVVMVCGGPVARNRVRIAEANTTLTHAEFQLRGDETYVRLECHDEQGKCAWSNALFA